MTGSSQWDTLPKEQFHAIIGIDLDGQVISAPITQPTQQAWSSFNGQVQISGSFTEDQAKTLATDFTYGALPVKLDRLTVQTVSPSLGKSSLKAGLISGLAGLALVMLYIIFYYRLLGLVVLAGLAVTAALLWAIIAFMGQSLEHHHQPGRHHRPHRLHRDHRRLVHRLFRTPEGRDPFRPDHPDQCRSGLRQCLPDRAGRRRRLAPGRRHPVFDLRG